MAIKYCPANGCGFRNEYSITPPKKCSKCNASFTAVFKAAAVAAVEDDDEEEIVIVKKKKPVAQQVKRVPTMLQRVRQAQASGNGEEVEEVDADEEELEAEESDDNLNGLSADELAASLDPDNMIRFTTGGDGPTKLGSWVTQPKA